MKLTSSIYDAFTSWADATRKVDVCRRNEIANAVSRHRARNSSQTEKDKGRPVSFFVSPLSICWLSQMLICTRPFNAFFASDKLSINVSQVYSLFSTCNSAMHRHRCRHPAGIWTKLSRTLERLPGKNWPEPVNGHFLRLPGLVGGCH